MLTSYTGNYTAYVAQKADERKRQAQLYEAQQERIRQLQQRIREAAVNVGHNRAPKDNNKMAYNGHGHSVDRAVARNIHAAEAELARLLENAVPRPHDLLEFQPNLNASKVHHNIVVSVRDVSVLADDGRPILDHVSLTLGRQEHALIVGPNGAGKSTLLSVIAGEIHPAGGEVFVPAHVQIGYLPQEPGFPDPKQTVLTFFARGLAGDRGQHISKLLSYQLFEFRDFERRVGALSPGQARKLYLAHLIEQRPHLLLIDEPSNHLSFDVLAALEEAIARYQGPY